jgi:hypothetical protein
VTDGAGSALTVLPIQAIIKTSGYETVFLHFGIAQGFIVFLVSFGLNAPDPGDMKATTEVNVRQSNLNYRPTEVFVILSGLVFFAWGRDIQLVSFDLHRFFRAPIRRDECGAALYGQRHGLAARSVVERAHGSYRELVCSVLCRCRDECNSSCCRSDGAEADAPPPDRARSNAIMKLNPLQRCPCADPSQR